MVSVRVNKQELNPEKSEMMLVEPDSFIVKWKITIVNASFYA